MIKTIDKEKFLHILGEQGSILFPSAYIPPISYKLIDEFRIKKKYIYKFVVTNQFVDIHQHLQHSFLEGIPVCDSAIAFRRNKSYLHFLEPHRYNFYFMRLDIKNFFHSISRELLLTSFEGYFEDCFVGDEKRHKLIESFVNLVSYKVPNNSMNDVCRNRIILPIGFKTSPSISNIVFRKLDLLIQKYCSIHNITFTRYADDMLFSSPKASRFVHSDTFYSEIRYLLMLDGFKLNERKTIKSNHTISLNGYIVESNENEEELSSIRISVKKTKKIEKLLHEIKLERSHQEILNKLYGFTVSSKFFSHYPPKQAFIEQYCRDQVLNKIQGYRSYLISVLNFDQKYDCVNVKAIEKYKKLIESLNKKINAF